ncbi:unnamed protein product [Adineta steineri]|uniref:Uncharacterized protein n=1 Tax=Adineta steineri TaxID=433720 RepID=A0A819CNU4_9BILA|nr:unnamed protein product [Adineta steineri]
MHKVSLVRSALEVFQKATEANIDLLSMNSNKAYKVYVRLMFLRIGEIDTLNEKYQAQIAIESRWSIELDKISSSLSSDELNRLLHGKSISLMKYAETNWHPQLYVENALGDLKEQIRYSARKSKIDSQIYIREYRDIKGLFWEKLELHHFPSDVQDLSISIGSMFYNDKVILIADPNYSSGVNREAFVDQQEWSLYEHVDTQQRYIKEFLFREDNDDEEEEEDRGNGEDDNANAINNKERYRSILTVTCHAARRSNYFYWNGYWLIFLITIVSFCIFSIPPNLAANRLQICCTLLLTSITFRWTVNRSLPTISYLTTMDKYAIMCLFILVILSIWHAIIGGLIFYNTPDSRVTPASRFVHLDQYVLYLSIGIFILIHVILFIWLFCVPLKHRRQLKEKDIQYRRLISEEGHLIKKKSQRKSDYIPISIQN